MATKEQWEIIKSDFLRGNVDRFKTDLNFKGVDITPEFIMQNAALSGYNITPEQRMELATSAASAYQAKYGTTAGGRERGPHDYGGAAGLQAAIARGEQAQPGQASPEQIARFNAGEGEYAPNFNIAAAGSGAGGGNLVYQNGITINKDTGQILGVGNLTGDNKGNWQNVPGGASSVPINAPGISNGQVNQENFYIGATNWANLQKQFTPAQLEAATKLIDGKRYWNQAVEIGKLNAQGQPITSEILKGGERNVNLDGTTTGSSAGATATSNTNIAADQAVADIEARQKIIEQTQTAEQKQAEGLDKTILDLIGQEKGKASFEEEQRKKLIGEGEANLNTQLTKSKNRILALQAEKQKVLTDIENKPITLSSIAGQQAQQLAKYNSEILLETAISNGLMNNISLAEQQITQAVNAKFAPTEEALRIARAQRDAIRGQTTADEKIQLDALDKADETKKQQIADAKTEMTNIKNIMLEAIRVGITDNNILSKITNAKSLTEAMRVLGENMPNKAEDVLALKGYQYVSTPDERDRLKAQGYEIIQQSGRTYAKTPKAVKIKSTLTPKDKIVNNDWSNAKQFIADNPNATPQEIKQVLMENTKLNVSEINSLIPPTKEKTNVELLQENKAAGVSRDAAKEAGFTDAELNQVYGEDKKWWQFWK